MRKTFSLPVAASAGGGAPPNNLDNIDYSLRLIKADDHYLSRSSVAGNSQRWTWSGWVKKAVSDDTEYLFTGYQSVSNTGIITCYFGPSGQLRVAGSNSTWFDGEADFRDTAAWYHVVVAVDSTKTDAADQVKVYVNGTEQVATSRTAMTVNQTTGMNMNQGTHYIGSDRTVSHSDLYIADVQMVDGQALSAVYFGFLDSDNVWQPKAFNQSYGTNGYHLDFADVTSVNTYGNDVSGNNNDFTAYNIDSTDVMYDSPVNSTASSNHRGNYCTLNVLNKGSNSTLSAGNLEYNSTGGGPMAVVGTMAVTSGKWYYETICPNAQLGPGYNPSMFSGVVNLDVWDKVFDTDMFATQGNGAYGYAWFNGNKTVNGSYSSFHQGGTAKDTNNNPTVIGVALNLDTGTISIYENGSSLGTIATGVSGMFAPIIDSTSNQSGQQAKVNFGQQGFEYPLSGYAAWSSAGLSTPSIADGSEHINTAIWTGDAASSRAITGLNHGSDFVWIKRRDSSAWHVLTDSVRGPGKLLSSNVSNAQVVDNNTVISFNNDGFTIGNTQNYSINTSQGTFVGWSWKAGGTGSSNTAGTITSTVSANPTSGFSISKFTAPQQGSGTFGHGLNTAPGFVIMKSTASFSYDWRVYLNQIPSSQTLNLNSSALPATENSFNGTAPTSSVVSVGSAYAGAGETIAYNFAEIEGFSKIGTYQGNSSSSVPPFINTGFTPSFIIIKAIGGSAGSWYIYDTGRQDFNHDSSPRLITENSDPENISFTLDIVSNGFKIKTNSSTVNYSLSKYAYIAFAEHPFKTSRAR